MEDKEQVFSKVLITLIKGVMHKEDDLHMWNALLEQRYRIEDYLSKIGLELVLDDVDHYSYIKQDEQSELPKLSTKHQLNYYTSLLLVILRKKLLDFDTNDSETRLIVTTQELQENMKVFLKDTSNEVKQLNAMDTTIKRLVDLGVLRPLKGKNNTYEVLRIIRSLVDAQVLNDVKSKLEEYYVYAQEVL